ncbi:MAG: ATP-binding cassette domain-containing protein [Polyangiaceae bacterium]|jgi:phospholipid/cholesterol/gamma-HCH transport system ATP-binding protein|nr:ATP-binding cassette domain-containing protein [Polyangiaceae bacterium]MBK8936589.1 ATP-binding cassette domain-containing protein [Polyangiaceae bacterium]
MKAELAPRPGSVQEEPVVPPAPNGPSKPVPAGLLPDDHIFVDNVVKRFGDTLVLRGVTMHLKRHQTAVVIGGSGAGKTTLLRMLIALEKPTTGHIWVDGDDIAPLGEVELNRVRQRFGMVFQYAALLDSLTIFENVVFPLREHRKKMSRRDQRTKVLDMLKLLGLEGKEDRMPSELSGGQRKRVGLARALMLEPKILIYDEPTSGLDPITSRMVDDLIEETRDRFQVTSVVISHDMTSTMRIAHQAFLLVRGEVIASGTPDDLAYGDNEAAREFIMASGIAPDRLSRVGDEKQAGDATVKYKAM